MGPLGCQHRIEVVQYNTGDGEWYFCELPKNPPHTQHVITDESPIQSPDGSITDGKTVTVWVGETP